MGILNWKMGVGVVISAFLVVSLGMLTGEVVKIAFLYRGVEFNKPWVENKESYRFQVIGDFGWQKNNVDHYPVLPLILVSESMKESAEKEKVDLIFTTGDNFYPDLDNVFDPSGYYVLQTLFNWTDQMNIPFFLTYGNHDCYTSYDYGEKMQLLYRNVHMPSTPYSISMPLGDHLIDFVFLSCNLFCLGPIDRHMKKQCKRIDFYNTSDYSEYKWLEKHYEDIKDDDRVLWKLVFVHFPIFSTSTSSGDSEGLKLNLYPIVHKYNVDFVVSGHNHLMQHLVVNKTDGQLPYVKQDYNSECMKVTHVNCPEDEKKMCRTRNVSCDSGYPNCKDRRPFDGFYDRYPYGNNLTYKKGEHLHQIVQGAGGGLLDPLCDSLSPMAEVIFAHCDFGFSEIYIDEERFSIKYIHANTSTVLFESTVLVNAKNQI